MGGHFPLLSVGDSRARRARGSRGKAPSVATGGFGGAFKEPRPPTILGHIQQNLSLKNESLKAK